MMFSHLAGTSVQAAFILVQAEQRSLQPNVYNASLLSSPATNSPQTRANATKPHPPQGVIRFHRLFGASEILYLFRMNLSTISTMENTFYPIYPPSTAVNNNSYFFSKFNAP
jgi:hypothetical protein